MIKNILRLLYNCTPMNFYTLNKGETIIKSINNTCLGYKFFKEFTSDELDLVWNQIKLHKRISSVAICLLFIYLLYEAVFPQFQILVNNSWYINAILLILVMILVCQLITYLSTKIFEKRITKKFGNYEKCTFEPSKNFDKKYYKLFKIELVKVLVLTIVVFICFIFLSPFNIAKRLLVKERYYDVIKYTTVCAKIFPIAQEWYSMRGYANYKLGNYKQAIDDFDKAYEIGAAGLNMTNFDNKIYLKYILKDYDSALEDFDKEINSTYNDEEKDKFIWDKAQFLYNIGKYEQALDIYTQLLVKAEDDKYALLKDKLYFERSQTYEKLGMTDEAKVDFQNSGITEDEKEDYMIPKPVFIFDIPE